MSSSCLFNHLGEKLHLWFKNKFIKSCFYSLVLLKLHKDCPRLSVFLSLCSIPLASCCFPHTMKMTDSFLSLMVKVRTGYRKWIGGVYLHQRWLFPLPGFDYSLCKVSGNLYKLKLELLCTPWQSSSSWCDLWAPCSRRAAEWMKLNKR